MISIIRACIPSKIVKKPKKIIKNRSKPVKNRANLSRFSAFWHTFAPLHAFLIDSTPISCPPKADFKLISRVSKNQIANFQKNFKKTCFLGKTTLIFSSKKHITPKTTP